MKKVAGKRVISIIVAFALVVAILTCLLVYHIGSLGEVHYLAESEEGDVRIACVGDSITYGTLVFPWPNASYPYVLDEMFGDGYCVNDYGYAGRCAQNDGDKPYTKEKLYKQSIDFAPEIVVIMLGTNDTRLVNWKGKEEYKQDYAKIIDRYKKLPSLRKMYIMVPPPAIEFLGKVRYHIQGDKVEKEVKEVTHELAKEKNLEVIDLYAVFDGKGDLFVDGVHPSAKGAKLLAKTVYNAIKTDAESIRDTKK